MITLQSTTPTPRELTILRHLAAGESNKEIAKALGLARGTVSVHLARLYEKISVTSRAAAVSRGFREGWLS